MINITVRNLNLNFDKKAVLRDFNLTVEAEKRTCILGESGSGKTTLLNILSGIQSYDSGSIGFSGTVSCLFQDLRLLPWRTVAGNLAFVLKGVYPHDVAEEIIRDKLTMVELWEERHSWPHQLSGGMKQRVALARSLAMPADLLILDEPFKGFDRGLRQRVMERCIANWDADRQTVLIVTHDEEEAVKIGHHIYRMADLQGNEERI